MSIIKRTALISIPLSIVCKSLGFKHQIDMYDDVYYEVSRDYLDSVDFGKYDSLKRVFPYPFMNAYESAGRSAYAVEIEKARNKDIINALLKINVPGEYVGMNSNDENIEVSCPAHIVGAEIDMAEDIVKITIQNPEHLVNDVIQGIGEFYPYEILADVASDQGVIEKFHHALRFFEVYGEPVYRTERIEGGSSNEEYMKEEVKALLEDLSIDDMVNALMELDSPQEGLNQALLFKDLFDEKQIKQVVANVNDELDRKKISA